VFVLVCSFWGGAGLGLFPLSLSGISVVSFMEQLISRIVFLSPHFQDSYRLEHTCGKHTALKDKYTDISPASKCHISWIFLAC